MGLTKIIKRLFFSDTRTPYTETKGGNSIINSRETIRYPVLQDINENSSLSEDELDENIKKNYILPISTEPPQTPPKPTLAEIKEERKRRKKNKKLKEKSLKI